MSKITHVSDTALWVAHFRGEESKRSDALFKDHLASLLSGEEGKKIAEHMPYKNMLAWIMAVRTTVIDRLIYEALEEGVDCVLNIGAGLDTRPYRMNLPSSLRWVEIDFPDMIEFKQERLKTEEPRCHLERHGLDFSNRKTAQSLYKKICDGSKKVLVLTEGVIIYLSEEQASELSEDLQTVPQIKYWVQDYRDSVGSAWRTPKGFAKKLKNAPFKFFVPDTALFFAKQGWKEKKRVLSMEEGEKLGRPFPLPFPWNFVLPLIPKSKIGKYVRASGYLMLEKP